MIEEGYTLVFLDESGFNTTPYIAKTWSLIGRTPIFKHPVKWYKISAISAVTTGGQLFFRLHRKKSVTNVDVVNFLRQILYQINGRIILFMDGLPQHKSKKVTTFIKKHERLEMRRLPAYSPDLNPDEGVWSYVKTRMIPNLVIKTASELPQKVKSSLHRLQRRKDLIVSFLLQSELPWDECSIEMLHNQHKAQ